MESFGVLFGRLIRDKRGIEGLSQDALAGKSGLTKARISNIETGKINSPQTRTVDALCVALNISREERDACHVITGPRLPPRLLENLALRFGHSNPGASEDELEAFLKAKALEFRELQERLAQITAVEARITIFLAAANAALEEGDFQLADKCLAEAEDAQLAATTLPALEAQYRLRFERGHAALLSGEIKNAVLHWERAANYFNLLDVEVEAEKRYEYSTRLREYGYRYRSVEALCEAGDALERNLEVWRKEDSLENWCRATIALGNVSWRLSQFDVPRKFRMHVAKAKSIYETVHANCSEMILPYYYVASGANIASIYADRKFAKSEEECRANFKIALRLQEESLRLKSKTDDPEGWGILQHNMGCIYTDFCKLQDDKRLSMDIIDKAIHHLELSFQVRDLADVDAFQYWVASCRSLGEALIERSMHKTSVQASDDLQRAYEILSEAESKISEAEHPNQWAQIQNQLARCSKQRLRVASQE
jgi:transcriptional regulator with XRE-family HTH domain